MKRFPRVFLLLPLLLAACSTGEMRDTIGLNRHAPDEFTVVSRPPLSVPPEFELTPPSPGAPPRGTTTEDQARRLLLGTEKPATLDGIQEPAVDTAVTPVITSDAPSAASASFLARVGADQADADIRSKLGADISKPKPAAKADSLYEQVVGTESTEPVVDPAKESERLQKNREEGKPVNEGEVPVQDEKSKSVVDKIF